MNFIKEPEGVDFIIQSPPLSEKERLEISEFITARKLKKAVVKPNTKSKDNSKK